MNNKEEKIIDVEWSIIESRRFHIKPPSYYQYYNNVLSIVLFLYGSNWMVNNVKR